MNDPNKKFVSKDTGNKSSLKKSLSMFSTGITVVTTVDDNKIPKVDIWEYDLIFDDLGEVYEDVKKISL